MNGTLWRRAGLSITQFLNLIIIEICDRSRRMMRIERRMMENNAEKTLENFIMEQNTKKILENSIIMEDNAKKIRKKSDQSDCLKCAAFSKGHTYIE